MPPNSRDPSYVFDMLDAACSAHQMTRGIGLEAFTTDRKLYRAIEREIEIVGEAARRVSEHLKEAHPEVPWLKIVGTRHRLAHEYDEIRLEILHRIATVHLAELIPQLESILNTLPPPGQME